MRMWVWVPPVVFGKAEGARERVVPGGGPAYPSPLP